MTQHGKRSESPDYWHASTVTVFASANLKNSLRRIFSNPTEEDRLVGPQLRLDMNTLNARVLVSSTHYPNLYCIPIDGRLLHVVFLRSFKLQASGPRPSGSKHMAVIMGPEQVRIKRYPRAYNLNPVPYSPPETSDLGQRLQR